MLAGRAIDIGHQEARPLPLQFPIRLLLNQQHLLGFGIAFTPFCHQNSPSGSSRSPDYILPSRIAGSGVRYVTWPHGRITLTPIPDPAAIWILRLKRLL